MSIPKQTKKYLDKQMTKYDELAHKTVYTAYDLAQTLRKELKEIAKSLLIATDKAYVIAVVPAHMRIDLGKLKKVLKAKKVSIPNEKIMVKIFRVRPGAMTAFGGLHKAEVLEKAKLADFAKSGGYKLQIKKKKPTKKSAKKKAKKKTVKKAVKKFTRKKK